MPVFRPSARVELRLRMEELADTSALESRLRSTDDRTPYAPGLEPVRTPADPRGDPADQLTRNLRARTMLRRQASAGTINQDQFGTESARLDAERTRIQISIQHAAAVSGAPPSVAAPAPDDLTGNGGIQPLSVEIERNGLATADTCTIKIDFMDAPFDPRLVRAAAVEVTIGVVSAENFEAGASGSRLPDGTLASLVQRAQGDNAEGSTRFVGFVDDWAVQYADDGDTITLECRDMTAPLHDKRLPPGESIDLTLPIDRGIRELLNRVSPTTRGVGVKYVGHTHGAPAPVPATVGGVPRRQRARRGRVVRRARRSDQSMSVWDHITDVVRALGFLVIVKGFEVQIVEARTLYSTQGVRRMVYGRNIEKLDFSRRLQGTKVPTIEARSYDANIGRTRWARWPVRKGERKSGILGKSNPAPALRANEVPPSGANPTETIRVIQVSAVTDPNLLEQVARNAFEQIGRQEIAGSLSTYEVASFERPAEAADLIRMDAGDPVEVLIVAAKPDQALDGPSTSLATLQGFTRQRREDYLVGIGWSRNIAKRFARLQEATSFQTVFRTSNVRISWDHEDGIKTSVAFVNYITVREDAPAAENDIRGER